MTIPSIPPPIKYGLSTDELPFKECIRISIDYQPLKKIKFEILKMGK